MAEASHGAHSLTLFKDGETAPRVLPPDPPHEGSYLDDFLSEIDGHPNADGLTTAQILQASRVGLLVQNAADHNLHDVSLA
jgi:hypothetical protein